MESNWEKSKEKSIYHFDPTLIDYRWDSIQGLGHIEPCWEAELAEIISTSSPATWANRGYKGENIAPPPVDLAAEEYDLERAGMDPSMIITHLNWEIPTVLQRLSNRFGLDDCMTRIHVQKPGELWNRHIDKLEKWSPDEPDRVVRIMIQLTDWKPGQFWEYGNFHYNHWRAGDVTTFDWRNVPHCTANAGYDPRVTMQLTGIITDTSRQFFKRLRSVNTYKI
jgi:hypothetical protein